MHIPQKENFIFKKDAALLSKKMINPTQKSMVDFALSVKLVKPQMH